MRCVLRIEPRAFLRRSLAAPLAGAAALIALTGVLPSLTPVTGAGTARSPRMAALVLHLGGGMLAYLCGYLLAPAGRGDLIGLLATVRRRTIGSP